MGGNDGGWAGMTGEWAGMTGAADSVGGCCRALAAQCDSPSPHPLPLGEGYGWRPGPDAPRHSPSFRPPPSFRRRLGSRTPVSPGVSIGRMWIPAFAGMTAGAGMVVGRPEIRQHPPGFWIPACAGMTVGGRPPPPLLIIDNCQFPIPLCHLLVAAFFDIMVSSAEGSHRGLVRAPAKRLTR